MPVTSVTQSQTVDAAANVVDVLEITFTLQDKPGSFTVTVPFGPELVGRANEAIQELATSVGSIYTATV